MKKKANISQLLKSVTIALLITISGICMISVYAKRSSMWDKCTAETEAYLVDEYVEEYLYMPYHSVGFKTGYTTHLTYRVDFETESYMIDMSKPGQIEAASTLSVKYNPDDNSLFFYNTAELGYPVGDSAEWVCHTDNK